MTALSEYYRRWRSRITYLRKEKGNPGKYYSIHGFDYYKCIYVHIPRTAGISLNMQMFGNLGGGHKTLNDFRGIFPKSTFESYFKFAIVRNPWDRLYSTFHFLKAGGISKIDRAFMEEHLSEQMNFESFVMDWLDTSKTNTIYHLNFQIDFITLHENRGAIALDFTGRFENLQQDFAFAAKKIGLSDTHLQQSNASSKPGNYRDAFTKEMMQKVAAIYEPDVRMLHYEF